MKKRVFAAVLMIALLLALCACGSPVLRQEEAPLLPQAAADVPDELPDIDIRSWEFLLCNSYNSIGWWAPEYGRCEGQGLDPRVVEPVSSLIKAAREAGYTIYIAQGLRNLDWLETHFLLTFKSCDKDPVLTAKTFQGIGVNEHQTGLAFDFTDDKKNASNYDIFEDPEMFDSDLYAWLLENCADYGFIPRYPESKSYWYGVACPHAHFRYVGVDAARYIVDHDLCLEEFISLYDPELVYVPEYGRLD